MNEVVGGSSAAAAVIRVTISGDLKSELTDC